jgi:hypothetical protein
MNLGRNLTFKVQTKAQRQVDFGEEFGIQTRAQRQGALGRNLMCNEQFEHFATQVTEQLEREGMS